MTCKDKERNILRQLMEIWRHYFEELLEEEEMLKKEKFNDKKREKQQEITLITTPWLDNTIAKLKVAKAAEMDQITPERIKAKEIRWQEYLKNVLNEIVNLTTEMKYWNNTTDI